MTTLSRRTVVAAGIGTAGVAALGITVASLSTRPSTGSRAAGPAAGADLVRSRFTPLVGTAFVAAAGASEHRLVLDTVDDLASATTPDEEARFNLLFTHDGELPEQGIYTLRHPDTADTVLFLSPVGPEGQNLRIQALVDRSA